MIDLDSERWAELDHAYGDADDLPGLLRRLAEGDGEVMDELFGAVCHQGSIYSASYAVVPHLVAAAKAVSEPDLRAEILVLAGAIRASVDDRSKVAVSPDIRQSYEAAIPEALELAVVTLREPIDSYTAVHLLEAAAALKGHLTLGRVLSGFVDQEFAISCPGCRRELYVWPDGGALSVAAEDPVSVPATPRTPVSAGPLAGSSWVPAYEWLREVGGRALSEIGERLPFLFGRAVCPACACGFCPIDELERET